MDAMLKEAATPAPEPQLLDALVGRMLGELGAMSMLPLVRLGDRLGLYAALAEGGATTPAELARRAGTQERLTREWLSAHAVAGYLDHDPGAGRFAMSPEQRMIFADPDSPVCMLGAFEIYEASMADLDRVERAFRGDGRGAGYHGRCPCLFSGIERFFRPGYKAHLLGEWLPALQGVVVKLRQGEARVADVGCGHGASAILMAEAFPLSRFTGFDYHAGSIACAREAAARAGVAANTRFELAGAADFPGTGWDLIACFDALHDMGDPVGVAAYIRHALAQDGTFMVVEPRAGNSLAENMNPVGRLFYAASTMICTPVALDQAPEGPALGAQAGPAQLTAVLREAGFGRVRVAAETPFNMVIEARP